MTDLQEEDDLPQPFSRQPPSHPRSLASLGKRSRSYSYGNSSDAPYFSSDDLADACVDNYVNPRQKKQHRQPWWESGYATAVKADLANRLKSKPDDSGVFMSSDSSSNDDGFAPVQLSAQNLKRHGRRFPAARDTRNCTAEKPGTVDPEASPRSVIQACLEADEERVDLSNSALTSLSNEVLRPLRSLIRPPKFHQNPQADDAFRSFTPKLQLYLGVNSLRKVPGEILNLEYLTVLSLRNNKLTELPHSIGRLRNLKELNVAFNRLTWLPWELLHLCNGLGKMENLYLRPNPFFEALPSQPSFTVASSFGFPNHQALSSAIQSITSKIDSVDMTLDHEILKQKTSWALHLAQTHLQRLNVAGDAPSGCRTVPIYLGSTSVSFLDFDGTVTPSANSPPSLLSRETNVLPMASSESVSRFPEDCRMTSNVSAPSLFELALRACSENLIFADIDKYIPDDTPALVVKMLEAARNAEEDGGTKCSVCQKKYIVPRAEWVEYWFCWSDGTRVSVNDLFFPFLRRACSWSCADEALQDREERWKCPQS